MTNRQFEIEIYLHYLKARKLYHFTIDKSVTFATHMDLVLPHVGVNWYNFYMRVFAFKNNRPNKRELIHYMYNSLGHSYRDIQQALKVSPNTIQNTLKKEGFYRLAFGEYAEAIAKWEILKKEVNLF